MLYGLLSGRAKVKISQSLAPLHLHAYDNTQKEVRRLLDISSEKGSYLLGVLWGCLSVGDKGGFWLRHKDPFFVEFGKDLLGISSSVIPIPARTGTHFRLKITKESDSLVLKELLFPLGWTNRQAQERSYPTGRITDVAFCRAWVEMHGSFDIGVLGRPRKATPRVRIYGNHVLMEEMSSVIGMDSGLGYRKPQKTPGNRTKGLYYTGASVASLLSWLYRGATIYNPQRRAEMEAILSS